MAERPYTVLSCAMSIDGYLDDGAADRLVLSTEADFDRVDAVRAGCDAILVGAGTVRRDDPRLVVRSSSRRAERVDRGMASTPLKVTVTAGGQLDPEAAFFTTGDVDKVVYCPAAVLPDVRRRLGAVATVVCAGERVDMTWVGTHLHAQGVRRLMVEGGRSVLTAFLAADLADELQLVMAPVFVGDSRAPRLVGDAAFPWSSGRRATLAEVRQIDDSVLVRYSLSPRFQLT
ncbi:MAG: dihydrofolate reductase family protein [Lapillicoccus sp.]